MLGRVKCGPAEGPDGVSCFLQHLRLPNGDHLVQRQGQRVPRRELRRGGCVRGLTLHPPGLDQHAQKGTVEPLLSKSQSEVQTLNLKHDGFYHLPPEGRRSG